MEIVLTPGFLRSVKRLSPDVQERIGNCLSMLSQDPFQSALRTHKLRGSLSAFFSCSVTKNYRILFTIEYERLTVYRFGSHDDVY